MIFLIFIALTSIPLTSWGVLEVDKSNFYQIKLYYNIAVPVGLRLFHNLYSQSIILLSHS
jgi:hypothetical protein